MLNVAFPEALRAMGDWAVPSMVNVTVPAGVPPPGATAATVAVKIMDWPNTEGLIADVTTVVVSAAPTDWFRPAEVLVLKLASPLYTAVIVWLPTLSAEVAKVAWPALSVLVES